MASLFSMDSFVYKPDSVHQDWPSFKQRLQLFLKIKKIGFKVVTAVPNDNPLLAVMGETTEMALNYLLHSGGPKILEIYNASPGQDGLNYATFSAILDERFAVVNPQIADYHFRSCKQATEETLADYAIRLRSLAIIANIQPNALDQSILSVIRTNTEDHDTRMKCLDEATSLATLLTWRKSHDLKDACATLMEKPPKANVFNIKHDNNQDKSAHGRTCFNCGLSYPHLNEICPAKGKVC